MRAVTRAAGGAISRCELEFLARVPLDPVQAALQHQAYEQCLRELGLDVISLPADDRFPDGLFVEDPAIVLDEIGVICRPGAASRRGETASLAAALAPFRRLEWIREPATIEGGDVMRLGQTIFCGISRRTNEEGARQLGEIVRPFGYRVQPVKVAGCLHLKSAICPIAADTVLANPRWIDIRPFEALRVLPVPGDEPSAANVLRIGDTILMPSSFPNTRKLLERNGSRVLALDISELQKAEAGVTRSSLIFESGTEARA